MEFEIELGHIKSIELIIPVKLTINDKIVKGYVEATFHANEFIKNEDMVI